jgi:adenine-specific DNA-methyltransferase
MRIVDEFMKRCKEIELTKGRFSNQVMGYELSEFFQHGFQLAKVSGQTLVYLDPPYTSAQYSRYYHLIETVFLNDRPEVAFKGLYRSDRHQSNFCSSTKVEEAFENAIHLTSSRSCNLLISYSNAGLITLDRLKKLCKSYYPSVNLRLTNYAHSMQGRGQVSDRKEALLECQL